MFWASPNVLGQTKNLYTFWASPQTFWATPEFPFSKFGFYAGTKGLEEALNPIKFFLYWHKMFWHLEKDKAYVSICSNPFYNWIIRTWFFPENYFLERYFLKVFHRMIEFFVKLLAIRSTPKLYITVKLKFSVHI